MKGKIMKPSKNTRYMFCLETVHGLRYLTGKNRWSKFQHKGRHFPCLEAQAMHTTLWKRHGLALKMKIVNYLGV